MVLGPLEVFEGEANVSGTPSNVVSFEYNAFPLVENCEEALLKEVLRARRLVVFTTPGAIRTSSSALPAWRGGSSMRL